MLARKAKCKPKTFRTANVKQLIQINLQQSFVTPKKNKKKPAKEKCYDWVSALGFVQIEGEISTIKLADKRRFIQVF